MDILWVALAVCVIVGFVFVVLARHWQRLLAHQSWTIRRLTDRIASLEEVSDPNFRRKLDESAPSPLERVYNFGFRLSEDFWRKTLKMSPRQIEHIREYGNFLGSVKIEQWRSHTVVSVTEVLPQAKSASWQTRSFDIFPHGASTGSHSITLWEMSLAEAHPGVASGRIPTLELRWKDNELELCERSDQITSENNNIALAPREQIFFAVPLDPERLAPFRAEEDFGGTDLRQILNGSAESKSGEQRGAWLATFARDDASLGIAWNLTVRDLTRQTDWKRWKVFEGSRVTKAG
jgi:hypothetical protein